MTSGLKPNYSEPSWRSLAVGKRCRVIADVAVRITEVAEELSQASLTDQRTDVIDTLTAEILPLCAALTFVGKRGPKLLKSRRLGISGRPVWLLGVHSEVAREPFGRVLVLGAWNYPLFLAGVQTAQALAAGNEVLLKPAIGCESITEMMVESFYRAGVPRSALQQIDSSTQTAVQAIDDGVDLIVLTGSAGTGRQVLRQAADSLTPAIMELSGCDAAIVLDQDTSALTHAAKAIAFGLTFNSGATCIAPRRLLVERQVADQFLGQLHQQVADASVMTVHPAARDSAANIIEASIAAGAVVHGDPFDADALRSTGRMKPVILDQVQANSAIANADLFAPITSVIRVADSQEAVKIVNQCPYRLAASVFGPSEQADQVAAQLNVGSVCINDVIVPTADPRVPFGGRGQSGFGVTRGAEGLLAMTVPKVTSRRRGRFAPHLMPRKESDQQTLLGVLQWTHAKSFGRFAGLRRMISASRDPVSKNKPNESS